MALLTKRVIMTTFQQMLEEMPFDKITVSALVRRCQISSNTFYYHYQDIYAKKENKAPNEKDNCTDFDDLHAAVAVRLRVRQD